MNPLFSFLIEIVQRLRTKSPKFFNVLKIIAAIATALTGLPGALKSMNIALPANLCVLENKTVAVASIVVLIMAQLTVIDPSKLSFSKPANPK